MPGYYAVSDKGYGRTINEDRVDFIKLSDDSLSMMVFDGEGSKDKEGFQPAAIIANEIKIFLNEVNKNNEKLFTGNISYFLRLAILNANRVLGGMKIGSNAEDFGGFAASGTICLIHKDELHFAHCGNTRLYLLRAGKDNIVNIKQLTKDQTKAQKLIDEGYLSPEDYMVTPDKMICTSGIGILTDPVIQTVSFSLKKDDIILMSSDGLHYAVRTEFIKEILLRSGDCEGAAKSLVEAAETTKYMDNASAIVYSHS